jgi:hypothetical protein
MPRPPVSVILIRENAEQLTGSGCCGKLEGDDPLWPRAELFAHGDEHRHKVGVLHRVLREFFPPRDGQEPVSVVVVDPRNQPYLIPKLWHDVLVYRPPLRDALATALQWFRLPAVIVNGRVVSRRGELPDPDAVCHLVAQLLPHDN